MSARGRGPDSTLVHMSPREVEGLQKLAVANGTSLTINPDTGLPEAFSLQDLLPTLIGGAATYLTGGAITPLMAALGTGAVTALTSKDLGKGLMAGLGAYGGAGITQGLMGLGTGALSAEAGAAASQGLEGVAADQAAEQAIKTRLADASNFDTLSAGASKAMSDPMGAVKALGGGSAGKGFATLAGAISPLLAGETGNTVQTVTKRPSTAVIRPYRYDNMSQTFEEGTPYAAANGGLMGLAHGGAVRRFNGETGSAVNPFDPNANFMASNGPDARTLAYINERFGTNNTTANTTTNAGEGFAATPTPVATAAAPVAETAPLAAAQVFPTEVSGIAALSQAPVKVAETAPMALNNALTTMGAGKGMSVQDASMKVLGRQLSPTELSNWNASIGSDDVTAAELSKFSIAAQPERALGINNTNDAIRQMYLDRLGRYPDASGLAYFNTKFGPTVEADERKIFDAMTTEEFEANVARDKANLPKVVTDLTTAATNYIAPGVGGSTGAGQIGGGTTVNPNGTITTSPRIPGIPVGGFTGMTQVRDAYTKGGGDLGYTSYAPKTIDEFNKKYTNTGYQKEMYDYLMGKGDRPTKTKNADGTFREISRPYKTAVLGVPESTNVKRFWDKTKGEYFRNPDYVRQEKIYDPTTKKTNVRNYMSVNSAKAALTDKPYDIKELMSWAERSFVDDETLSEATGLKPFELQKLRYDADEAGATPEKKVWVKSKPAAKGGLMSLANGGVISYFNGGPVDDEYTDSTTGDKYILDNRYGGGYRKEKVIKDGLNYTWDRVSNSYKLAGAGAGIAGLMDMSGGSNAGDARGPGTESGPGGGYGIPGETMVDGISGKTTGLASGANKLAAFLGNLGLTTISDHLAKSIDPNFSHEGRLGRGEGTVDLGDKTFSKSSLGSFTIGPNGLTALTGPTSDDAADRQAVDRQTATDARENAREGLGVDFSGADSEGTGFGGEYARGGIAGYAQGGLGSLGGYSDGGRLLRGPGDGVSDSIPASIGDRQPARLADGEFVVPARIVSELGNGSTEAGARALYKMMARIQANRRKTTGKNSVAVDSKAHKYLPA